MHPRPARRARSGLPVLLCAALACAAAPPAAGEDTGAPAETGALRERLDQVEARLDLIDRKFQLLAARDEAELIGGEALLDRPDLLLERARAAIAADQLERAYRYLALIEQLHPASPQCAEAFPLAAKLFQVLWHRNRYAAPDSEWLTSEPVFLFQWLARYDGEGFPEADAAALLQGMPVPFLQEFQAWAASRPRLAAWQLHYEKDDGVVEKVWATPVAAPGGTQEPNARR